MKFTPDIICAIALSIGLVACIALGDSANIGTIVGALAGYMGKTAVSRGSEKE